MGKKNFREWDDRDGGKSERESKERDVLIEEAIMGLTRPGPREIPRNEQL